MFLIEDHRVRCRMHAQFFDAEMARKLFCLPQKDASMSSSLVIFTDGNQTDNGGSVLTRVEADRADREILEFQQQGQVFRFTLIGPFGS